MGWQGASWNFLKCAVDTQLPWLKGEIVRSVGEDV